MLQQLFPSFFFVMLICLVFILPEIELPDKTMILLFYGYLCNGKIKMGMSEFGSPHFQVC